MIDFTDRTIELPAWAFNQLAQAIEIARRKAAVNDYASAYGRLVGAAEGLFDLHVNPTLERKGFPPHRNVKAIP